MGANFKVCKGCELRQGEVCSVSGREVGLHALHGQCPKGKFSLPILSQVVHAAAGVAKALIGIDRASPELIEKREATCRTCDKAVMVAGTFRKCSICGCATALKIMNAGEKCPEGRW